MTDRFNFARPIAPFALVLVVSLGACAQSGFVDEGSERDTGDENLTKSLLTSMGAIEDDRAPPIRYNPRPPLVVPPKRALPPPVDSEAGLADKRFPVNPEDAYAKQREARGVDPATLSTRQFNAVEREQYNNLPRAEAPRTPQLSEKEQSRPLTPEQLSGKEHKEALAAIENTAEKRREKSLLAPPEDYRTPSSKAPVNPAPESPSWKPSWFPF